MDDKKTLPGIVCNVTDCAYHVMNDKCTAPAIEVGGGKGCCSSCDTECVTFKPGK